MRHRVHIVDKFQQHPDRKDNTLVWLAQMVQPQIIPITYIGDPLFPFEVTDNFFRCIRRLIPQQPQHLCFRQCSILGQPFDYILLIVQQHSIHLLIMRILFGKRILSRMRFLFLPFPKDSLQFGPVRGNHFFLNLRSLNDYRNLIVVGADESIKRILLISGLHKIVYIYDNLMDAVKKENRRDV